MRNQTKQKITSVILKFYKKAFQILYYCLFVRSLFVIYSCKFKDSVLNEIFTLNYTPTLLSLIAERHFIELWFLEMNNSTVTDQFRRT